MQADGSIPGGQHSAAARANRRCRRPPTERLAASGDTIKSVLAQGKIRGYRRAWQSAHITYNVINSPKKQLSDITLPPSLLLICVGTGAYSGLIVGPGTR
ncbi:MAG: hypothetical protein QOJ73_3281 [Streptosporangiaceae bacterium]|jgi:hypothetical protein|nr:hypothetical protein [Streptosporangiaceae bacterium]